MAFAVNGVAGEAERGEPLSGFLKAGADPSGRVRVASERDPLSAEIAVEREDRFVGHHHSARRGVREPRGVDFKRPSAPDHGGEDRGDRVAVADEVDPPTVLSDEVAKRAGQVGEDVEIILFRHRQQKRQIVRKEPLDFLVAPTLPEITARVGVVQFPERQTMDRPDHEIVVGKREDRPPAVRVGEIIPDLHPARDRQVGIAVLRFARLQDRAGDPLARFGGIDPEQIGVVGDRDARKPTRPRGAADRVEAFPRIV